MAVKLSEADVKNIIRMFEIGRPALEKSPDWKEKNVYNTWRLSQKLVARLKRKLAENAE